jgi:ribosomal protein L2
MEDMYEDLSTGYLLAPEGIRIGDKIHISEKPSYIHWEAS